MFKTQFNFVCRFVYVHMDRQFQLIRNGAYTLQWLIGNRIRSVRGKRCSDQRFMAELFMQSQAFFNILLTIFSPNCRKIYQNQPDTGTHAMLYCLLGSDFRKKIHIVKTGGAASDHFSNRQISAIPDKGFAHPLLLQWPDMVLQPVH